MLLDPCMKEEGKKANLMIILTPITKTPQFAPNIIPTFGDIYFYQLFVYDADF